MEGDTEDESEEEDLEDFAFGEGVDEGGGDDVEEEVLGRAHFAGLGVFGDGGGVEHFDVDVHASARLDGVDDDETDDEGDRRDDLKVEEGETTGAADAFKIFAAGDAEDDGGKDDGGDDHLDELDEAVAEGFHGGAGLGGEVAEGAAEGDSEEDLDVKRTHEGTMISSKAMFFRNLILVAAWLPVLQGAELNYNIPLWEAGKVPLAVGTGPLDAPFLTVFRPTGKPNGSAVVIAPGGSNIMLMYNLEGIDVAEKFNDWGTTAFVLTYRLNPRYDDKARAADGNRAIRLIKSRAKEFGIDPERVSFAGFSAGSSMARIVGASATAGAAGAADPVERLPSKAHSLIMVYSAGRPWPGEKLAEFPPVFLLAAAHDRGAANGSAQLFLEMNKAGTVVELHLLQRGRHGFGAATVSPEYGPWMDQLKHFLKLNNFFGGAK